MSMLPRRTAEFTNSINVKQERLSRIAQPIRRTSRERSLRRTSSADQLANIQLNSVIPSSTIKTKRSVSATPLRTPLRTGRQLESTLQLTSEKDKDKKFIQEKAIKITEYIEKHIFKSKDSLFPHNNGLKTMSTKQFITILNHLLRFIVGNRFSISANYVDELPKILSQIGYPYTVNKSWLKTPTAPHAYHYIVTLLDWLLSFAPQQKSDNVDEEKEFDYEYIIPGEKFPNKEYTWKFLQREQEGFILWNNNKDDENEALKRHIMDDLVSRRTGLSGLSAVEEEIKQIKSKIDGIRRERKTIKHEKTFFQKDQEISDKQKFLTQLQIECEEKMKRLQVSKDYNESKLEMINSIKKRIHELEIVIKNQGMCMQERDNIISEINYLEQQLSAQKFIVEQLQDMGSNNQIIFARLLKRHVENIAKFNNSINTIFSGLSDLSTFNIKEMIVDQNSERSIENQLNHIVPILNKLKEKNYEDTKYYENEIHKIEKQLKELTYVYNEVLQEKYSIVNTKCIEIELELQKIDNHNLEKFIQIQKEIELLNSSIKTINYENENLDEMIKIRRVELEKYKIDNEKLLEESTMKIQSALNAKENYIQKIKESVNRFAKTMDDIEKSFRNEQL